MADSLELGPTTGSAATPFIDFHTLGAATGDYEARIIASGGTSGVTASGLIDVQAARFRFNGLAVATVFDVQDYGAIGNGTTDDTTAIQACINAAAGHGRVIIRAGMVCLVSGITVPSNTTLVLDGTVILKAGSNKSVLAMVNPTNNVLIEGHGTIDGNKAAQTGGFSEGIGISVGNRIIIRDVTVQNTQNMPVNIVGSKGCLVSNVTANNCGNSFEFAAGSEDCWAMNCRISNVTDFGFAFYGRTHKSGVIGCNISGCASNAITVLTDQDQGGGSTDIVIADNIMHDNIGGGIAIVANGGGTGVHSGVVVTGNRGYNNLMTSTANYIGAGVLLTNGYNVLIEGNSFGPDGAGGNTSGIYIQGNAGRVTNATIQNNVIIDQGAGGPGDSFGIFTDGADVNTVVRNNRIIDSLLVTTIDSTTGNVTYTSRGPLMSSGLRGKAGVGCVIEGNLVRGIAVVSVMDLTTNNTSVRNPGIRWDFNDSIVSASLSVSKQLTVIGAFAAGTTIGSTFPNSGLTAGWNLSAGGGEVDLFLGRGSGAGGLKVYSVGPAGLVDSATPILGLDRNGVLAVSDINIAGSGGMAGAWTSVSAPVTSSGGNLGSGAAAAVRYKKFGRSVYFNVKVLIPHVGTASGNVQVTLPFASAISSSFTGREGTTTGRGLNGITVDGGNILYITDCNGNFAAPVDGATLVLNGVYETTA